MASCDDVERVEKDLSESLFLTMKKIKKESNRNLEDGVLARSFAAVGMLVTVLGGFGWG